MDEKEKWVFRFGKQSITFDVLFDQQHPGNDDWDEWKADIDKHIGPKEGYNEGVFGRSRHDNMKSLWFKICDKMIRIFETPVDWFHG